MRLFVGIMIPSDLYDSIGGLMACLPSVKGMRKVPYENLHVTLSFIGEVAPQEESIIFKALGSISHESFFLRLSGVSVIERKGYARAVCAGIEKSEPLNRLQRKVRRVLLNARVSQGNRRYTPHVTLARMRPCPASVLGSFICSENLFKSKNFRVGQFSLLRSYTKSSGAQYTIVESYSLGNG